MDIGAGLGFDKQTPLPRTLTDIFVNAAWGSDSNDGSPGSPLRTFQEAVDRADESYHPGANNIFLAPGNYEGAYISDDDLLKVFGQGANPWDVEIRDFGDVIFIDGGSDVRLFNMQVDGLNDETARTGGHGIYANGLDYLFLNGVISRDNGGSGLYAEDVTKVKLYHSTFEDNRSFGAYINGDSNGGFNGNGNGYKVRSVGSDFSYNGNDGIRTENYDRVEMIASTAHNNGWNGGNLTEGGGSDVDGLSTGDCYSVLVSGGSYNYNDRRGIDINDAGDLTLLGVQASSNDDNGVDADRIYMSALVSGGIFEDNGNNGVSIQGDGEVEQLAGPAGRTEGLSVSVYGGQYLGNNDVGLEIVNAYNANLYGVDARDNEDGVEIKSVEYLLVAGGFLYSNYENGIEIENVYMSQVNDLVARENGENGLYLIGGYRLNIIGGVYSDNSDWGINVNGPEEEVALQEGSGGQDQLQRVDIKYATVLNNDGGVFVSYSYLAKMVGGTYSENYYDGIQMNNVSYGIFRDIVVINNGDNGLLFEAGLFDGGMSEESAGDYLGGSNWNRLEFTRGLYAHNGYDGILIATNRNRGWNVNNIEIEASYVVARDNGEDGFHVGGEFINGPALTEGGQFGFGSNLEIEMVGGYYGFNGDDGIDLLDEIDIFAAVEGLPDFGGGFLAGSFTDVVAEFNYDDGIDASGVVREFVDNLPDFVGDGGNGNGDQAGTLLQFTRGSYSHNGDHGMQLDYAILTENGMPCIEGPNGNGDFYSLASFDHVVAVNNDYNGVLFDVFVATSDIIIDTVTEGRGDGGQYPPLIEFYGGVFNTNGRNGIKLLLDFEFIDVEGAGGGFDIDFARLENVEASVNGRNGLYIRNFDPGFFRPDVDIINGIYNSNGKDGIHVRGFDRLYIDHVIAIGNAEDGVHSRDNWSTYISDDSIIVANGSQNVRID